MFRIFILMICNQLQALTTNELLNSAGALPILFVPPVTTITLSEKKTYYFFAPKFNYLYMQIEYKYCLNRIINSIKLWSIIIFGYFCTPQKNRG